MIASMQGTDKDRLAGLRDAVRSELTENILPFWKRHAPDMVRGGFIGRMANDLTVEVEAPKGLVLNARLLWTFSRACRLIPDSSCRPLADRAYAVLRENFRDPDYGGAFWTVDASGAPLNTTKKTYGQAFLIYGLAEYAKIAEDPAILAWARELFRLLEEKVHDNRTGGYFEAYERDWSPARDLRLSSKDWNEKKTMNTHLHVMEAFANLYTVWPDPLLKVRLEEFLRIFRDHIIAPDGGSLILFFGEDWSPKSRIVSYGHDIEASWLLYETAEILRDPVWKEEMSRAALLLSAEVLRSGRDTDGALFNEKDEEGILDTDRHFWVEAEAVAGFLNAYELSGDAAYREAALRCWEVINRMLIDRKNGDWFYRVSREGIPAKSGLKISEWKCPYHTSRMCFEVWSRLDRILSGS